MLASRMSEDACAASRLLTDACQTQAEQHEGAWFKRYDLKGSDSLSGRSRYLGRTKLYMSVVNKYNECLTIAAEKSYRCSPEEVRFALAQFWFLLSPFRLPVLRRLP